jgi:cytochrome c biogenesis protein CcmG/thiol:disulfide interchange protein DsbE
MGKIFYLGPLILFLAIATYFALPIIKGNDPRILPSVMINKPIPNLDLLPLLKTKPGIDQNSLRGDVRLVNFFPHGAGHVGLSMNFLWISQDQKWLRYTG